MTRPSSCRRAGVGGSAVGTTSCCCACGREGGTMALTIDPVRRELLKNALVTTADNALVMVTRTARTSNVKNSMDFSAAVGDGQGLLVGQGLAVPVHLGVVMPGLEACLKHFGDDIHSGDVLASNDP